jgi:peptidyl-prolyl cis-trans isomerase SurA
MSNRPSIRLVVWRKTSLAHACLLSRPPAFADPWEMKLWVPHPRHVLVFMARVGVNSLLAIFLFWVKLSFLFLVSLFVCMVALGPPRSSAQAVPSSSSVVLDRVVAVVNDQAILASDLDEEMRLAILDPARGGLGVLTPQRALQQLIARALIQQQIRREDAQSAAPKQAEVDARLAEIRNQLPACIHENCASDAGWKAFLTAHGLSPERVEAYLRYRIQILRFIEQRFRQGIQISPQEIATYYRETLLPQYAAGDTIPSLDQVASRIQEILLQQQVNALFDDWLKNLRKQGEVEVLDPALETPESQGAAGEGSL